MGRAIGWTVGAVALVLISFFVATTVMNYISPLEAPSSPLGPPPADVTAHLDNDFPVARDPDPLRRDAGSVILSQRIVPKTDAAFPIGATNIRSDPTLSATGKLTSTLYLAQSERSTTDIYQAVEKAWIAGGFKVMFVCGGEGCGRVFRDSYVRAREAVVAADELAAGRRWLVQVVFAGSSGPYLYSLYRKADRGQNTLVALTVGLSSGDKLGATIPGLPKRVAYLVEIVEPLTQ